MNFGTLDWIIVVIYLIATVVAGLWMRRFVGNVGDYIVAGRSVDTYLGVASLAATELGLVTVMYTAELGYKNGFAGMVPGLMFCLVAFFLGITGFIIHPLREAGVMTIPELFQTRYSLRVRWLAGVFIALGGILNMGIFLKLGGQFLVYCVGLPENNLELVMILLLALTLIYTVAGGMLSVLITDYLQFILLGLGIVITSVFVLYDNGWSRLAEAVTRYHGDAGYNPLLGKGQGVGWFFWQALTALAAVSTWQTVVARVLAAKDANTGKKIYTRVAFYYVGRFGLPGLWAIGALAVFGDIYLQPGQDSLAAMPTYIGTILPTGILGLVVAGMLAAE
ncbi:MAG: sodium:solute symporter family protein, partial [bacterium]